MTKELSTHMSDDKHYIDIWNDTYSGMTPTGAIGKDAWEPYERLVSKLPDDLRQRHKRSMKTR